MAYQGLARGMTEILYPRAMDRPIRPDEAFRLLRGARVVVAMRLHVAILASMAGTAVIPIGYSPKVSAWARETGIGEFVLTPDLDGARRVPELVAAALDPVRDLGSKLSATAAENHARIRESLPELRSRLPAAGKRSARPLARLRACFRLLR